jgi:hypothetical protein
MLALLSFHVQKIRCGLADALVFPLLVVLTTTDVEAQSVVLSS